MKIGDIEVSPVSDGHMPVPANRFFPSTSEEDWLPHRQFLTEDGLLDFEMGGFLVRTGERLMLVDAGMGRGMLPGFGSLLESLRAQGVGPEQVTDVVFTHLHFDHVGWATDEGRAVFPNATYRCHSRDWAFFRDPDLPEEQTGKLWGVPISPAERLEPVTDRIETWDGDPTIGPGVDVRTAPGHTPGSTVIILSSGSERAVLLGDVVHCPVEFLEPDWEVVADVDPDLARRTREVWAAELEGERIAAAAAHFPGMRFGRLLPGDGRRQWTFG